MKETTATDSIDYKEKFEKCIKSLMKNNIESDLNIDLTSFISNNFDKQLLFTHSLHPTNVLLYQLWKHILIHLSINIDNYQFNIGVIMLKIYAVAVNIVLFGILSIGFGYLIAEALT